MKLALHGLRRALETASLHIVEPAVIRAGDPSLLDPAVGEGRAAVRAAVGNQPHPPFEIAKQHQILAEDPYKLGGIFLGELAGYGNRQPIATQKLPCRRSRTDPGERLVFFSAQHGSILLATVFYFLRLFASASLTIFKSGFTFSYCGKLLIRYFPPSFGTRRGSLNISLGISVLSELLSVFFCHSICPSFESNQLTKTFAAPGWGALLIKLTWPKPPDIWPSAGETSSTPRGSPFLLASTISFRVEKIEMWNLPWATQSRMSL